MFSEDPQLRKIQESCLEILKATAKVCDENNLTYYLCGGTLLGAIRHKGFIPWDDDIDIIMPREDYKKLIEIANNQLPSNYELQHYSLINRKEDIKTHHVQIVDKNIDLLRKWTIKEEVIHPWVDVFPLDGMPNNVFSRYIHYYHYRFWHNCMQLSLFDQNVNIHKNRLFFEKIIIKFVVKTRIGNNWNIRVIIDKMETIATKYQTTYGDWLCSFHGIYKKKEILPSYIFKEKTLVQFEDSMFYCVKEYDKNLRNYYCDYLKYDQTLQKHKTEMILENKDGKIKQL